ncbi:hypothetical protein E0Z10_g7284 [Xylaria hypoxylon]|uniref:Infection structure specific protein n=1 Tax=Xylaria hypoxylon TaxID=37992 RepID=A0A4Z0YR08_9PEZI|nr:hypothetical protein E0Z10_g7284 [Xylaria hypoxylon]
MYSVNTLLSVATLAGISLAQSATSLDPSCHAELTELGKGVPTPAPALASWLQSAVGVSYIGAGPYSAAGQTTAPPERPLENPLGSTDFFCSVVAAGIPGSLVSDFRSYGSGLLSHASAHVSQYDAYITDCVTTGEAAAAITSAYHEMISHTGALVCPTTSSTATPGASSNGTYSTGTSSTPSPTASTTLVPTAAAARPTAAFVGAVAIGGLLGVVAML